MDFIQTYFDAEKTQSLIFILIGVIAIFIGLIFYFRIKNDFFNGFAIALLTVAVIQIAVGSSVYIQTPNQLKRAEHFVKNAQDKLEEDEIPRMQKVIWRLTIYKFLEIGVIIAGILMVIYARSKLYRGMGYGLIVQAFILLILDFFATNRANIYLEHLQQIL